jgi:polyhydroxybutyrate depolymerase
MRRAVPLGVAISVAALLPARAVCPPAPRAACRLAPMGTLRITKGARVAGNRLRWTWRGGVPTTTAAFGDPTTSTAVTSCIYDAAGLVAEVGTRAGRCGDAPCWRRVRSTGFVYHDRAAASADLVQLRLRASRTGKGTVLVRARGPAVPDLALPLAPPLTIQLLRDDADVCFETIAAGAAIARSDARRVRVKAALDGAGCGRSMPAYPLGVSTRDMLVHDGLSRTFRVYVPPGYDGSGAMPAPVVLVLHGGFGSGALVEASTQVVATAAAAGFIAVSPDGVAGDAGVRTWNGGTCCGHASATGVDDVGFIAALLDHLETRLCLDRRRVYAMGISNGAILSYRLACELAARIRAIGPVAGTLMIQPCEPARPVPVLHVHGTADRNVPFEGGSGCGVAGVAFTSVSDTIAEAVAHNGCAGKTRVVLTEGDGTCSRQGSCPAGAEVRLCTVANGGHVWPGGQPALSDGLFGCPTGYQSQSFDATTVLWDFFRTQPPR